MEIRDLMIGDFVQVNGEVFKVISISYFDIGICDSKKDFYHEHIDNIAPIPLTPEILEKNGFMKSKNGEMTLELDDALGTTEIVLVPSYDEVYYWWKVNNELITKIKSIHELQHALRLCGIDKEIKV